MLKASSLSESRRHLVEIRGPVKLVWKKRGVNKLAIVRHAYRWVHLVIEDWQWCTAMKN